MDNITDLSWNTLPYKAHQKGKHRLLEFKNQNGKSSQGNPGRFPATKARRFSSCSPGCLRMDLISLGPFTSHSEDTRESNPGPLRKRRPGVTDCGIRPTLLLVKKKRLIQYISPKIQESRWWSPSVGWSIVQTRYNSNSLKHELYELNDLTRSYAREWVISHTCSKSICLTRHISKNLLTILFSASEIEEAKLQKLIGKPRKIPCYESRCFSSAIS